MWQRSRAGQGGFPYHRAKVMGPFVPMTFTRTENGRMKSWRMRHFRDGRSDPHAPMIRIIDGDPHREVPVLGRGVHDSAFKSGPQREPLTNHNGGAGPKVIGDSGVIDLALGTEPVEIEMDDLAAGGTIFMRQGKGGTALTGTIGAQRFNQKSCEGGLPRTHLPFQQDSVAGLQDLSPLPGTGSKLGLSQAGPDFLCFRGAGSGRSGLRFRAGLCGFL